MKRLLLTLTLLASAAGARTFEIGETDFLLDGQRLQIRCGEIHAARVPQAYWRHRLKMCKAMGLNAVCAYLFWNQHEPRPGQYDWSGQADAALFCRLAQEEGLWVILRPGPYACAEWEMGGTPWWLLKHTPIALRSRDPNYLTPAAAYLREVGRVLAPLQITRGGPILMVQAENEYGFFGSDAAYMGEIRQALVDGGFDVPLFACNPPGVLRRGYREDLFQVVNFGADPAYAFGKLRELQPKGPLMCGEFYPAWFDSWGQPHHTGDTARYLRDLEIMLKMGASFSIYMAHGGTTFGLWSGANAPYAPETSSYDYSAPISEAGWVTEKFEKSRALMAKYLLPGETIPEPPPPNPVMRFPLTAPEASVSLFNALPEPRREDLPRTMEAYDQGFGCMLYRTEIPAGSAAALKAAAVKDFAYVYVDSVYMGILDRRYPGRALTLPARGKPARLDILLEAMGRINFGGEMLDRKGLHTPVTLGGAELKGWEIFNLPMENPGNLPFSAAGAKTPAFHRFNVDIEAPADTFLDLRACGKGIVWVNGICLARYWNIGPTQTAYLPGCWLKKGKNEIIVWDLAGTAQPTIQGLENPILDQNRPELDWAQFKRPAVTWSLGKPVAQGEFARSKDAQTIRLTMPASARQVCLEAISSYDGHGFAAISEIDFLDADGNPISHDGWTVAGVGSEELVGEDGSAENAIDGQTANHWHTRWKGSGAKPPHRLAIDLGKEQIVGGFRYVPRQSAARGWIREFRFYIGNDLVSLERNEK